jgi:RNA-directed DNA polymerase
MFCPKCDVRKFFANINHDTLKTILRRHIQDEDVVWLLGQVIDSFYSTRPGVGLPLGNLTSQLLVNIYMHEFDMYVKQELLIKYYVRYADDFVILSDKREYLEQTLKKIETFLDDELHLQLHEDKVSIQTYSSGVDFLGWIHFPQYRQLRTTTKRRVMYKMKGFPKREAFNSYRGLLQYGNTYTLRKKFKELV